MGRVVLSHPDKVLFPADGITKADLADYYERVAPAMLPHVRRRPLNLWRWNAGIDRQRVVQQEIPKGAPEWVHRVNVPRNRSVGYLRVLARLDDGSTAEDSMSLNTTELGTHIDVRLVQLAVVVTDANGKPVPGLPRDSFRLRQDGQEQEIAAFENAGELPLTVALAIDSSASMFLKLPDVRKAVASLLNTGLTDRDRAMLIDFDSRPRLVRPLTRDPLPPRPALGPLRIHNAESLT